MASAAGGGDDASAEFELLYWHGSFAGRGEFLRLVLDVCGVTWRDVAREEGSSKPVLEYIRAAAPGGSYPVLFPPILKHGSTVMNQTVAAVQYVASGVEGMWPTARADVAHAVQLSLLCMDIIAGAEAAFHPADPKGSYADQVEEAKPTIKAFLDQRVPVLLSGLEKPLAAEGKPTKGPFVFGDKLQAVDLMIFNTIRGYRSSNPDHYAANDSIPALKAHTQAIEADPRVAAFLASDRCTKLESKDATPTGKDSDGKEVVQVNSWM